jgi:hypothetical protein
MVGQVKVRNFPGFVFILHSQSPVTINTASPLSARINFFFNVKYPHILLVADFPLHLLKGFARTYHLQNNFTPDLLLSSAPLDSPSMAGH